ncbi:MAG: transcriptional regulator [Gemmatimonas sp.]
MLKINNIVAEVFSPGEHLREELEARGWTAAEFADMIDSSCKQVDELLGGKAKLTRPMAATIADVLGTSTQLWLNVESAFRRSRQDTTRIRY